jgi:hypothetical protein
MFAETLIFNTSLFTLHEKSDTLGRNAGYAGERFNHKEHKEHREGD